MSTRARMQICLYLFILLGTLVGQVVSLAHMLEAFTWANTPFMALPLAVTTVVLSATFVALAILGGAERSRPIIWLGIALLGLVEFLGNYAVGGVTADQHLPLAVAGLFGLPPALVTRLAAFALSGFVPLTTFLAVLALSLKGAVLLREPEANPFAAQLLHAVDPAPHAHASYTAAPDPDSRRAAAGADWLA